MSDTFTLDDLLAEPAPLGQRALNAPHVLVLAYDEHGEPDFTIEHHDDCPTVARWDGEVLDYDCAVGVEVASSGVDFSFSGCDEDDHSYAEPLRVPGRYLIEWWSQTHRGFDYTEYDAGLRLVYPEEAAQ